MFDWEQRQESLIIHLKDELNYFNANEIKEKIKSNINNKTEKVILNLSNVERMDSSGVGVIISILKHMEGKTVALVNPQPNIARVFEITRLEEIVPIYPTLEEAL